jgi:hypothetical protein
VQDKGRERVSVLDYLSDAQRAEALADAIPTLDMKAAVQAAIDALFVKGGGILDASGLRLRFNAGASGVVVDGDSPTLGYSNAITIVADGTKIYHYGTGGAIQFLDADRCKLLGRPAIYLVQDLVSVYGIHLKHSRWGRYEADIYNGTDPLTVTAASDNRAFYLESGPSNTFDNLYNTCLGRARKTGWAAYLSNADSVFSRNNGNTFDIEYNSTNGIRLEGCEGNHFAGALETGVGIPISLKQNADGILTRYNTFDFVWVESGGHSNWTFEVDAGCTSNTFNVGNLDNGVFNLPGQTISVQGNGGTGVTNTLSTTAPRDAREDVANIVGIGSRNFLLASEDFSHANWTKTNCTITANSVASPDGTTTADTLEITSANGGVAQTTSGAGAGIWTGSVWLKAATPHTARLRLSTDNFATNPNSATRYIYVTTEWQRFHLTLNATGGGTASFIIHPADLGVASGEVYAWGACLNKGYLGQYINTGTNATPTDVGPVGHASAYPSVIPWVYFNQRVDDGVVFNNFRKIGYASAAPSSGAHTQGDRVFNYLAAVGQPKGWICTVSGTPGTWVSEGNL